MKDNPCLKFGYLDNEGNPVYIPKKAYDTDKEAIEVARMMNCKHKQIHKAVAYKCPKCGKWHVGRNTSILTDKDKKHYKTVNKTR